MNTTNNTQTNTQINNNITFTDNRGRTYNVNESYDNLLYIHELMCAKYVSGDYNGHTKEVFESMIEEVEMKLKTMLLSGYGFNPKQIENKMESNMQDYLYNNEYEAAHQELMSLLDQANDHEFEMANELSHEELYAQIMEDNEV